MQPFEKDRVTAAGRFGQQIEYHSRIASTQDRARELAAAGAPEGTVVITDLQQAGRGRMGRVWITPPNTALLMSIIFRPQLPPQQAPRLIMACGMALLEAVEEVTIQVKWPNDLQIDGLKLAGILPEGVITGQQLEHVIVGMGVNVNQVIGPGDDLYGTATSLRMAAGRIFDREVLLSRILRQLTYWNDHLTDDTLRRAWESHCVTLGSYVRIRTPEGIIEGEAASIDEAGALVVLDEKGTIHRATALDATLLRAQP
ncbi:MAG: biotin--[acetyl-CoA-carboxylase] ligase [Chloroflexi bacterium]|nr:biotin--[acetyl-CoA-carboxylase] ligase [Chloroflexota bacterium]